MTCAVLELDHPDASTQRASSRLERAVSADRNAPAVLVVDGEQIEIPEALLRVLLHAVHEQAAGHRIRILSPDSDDELTPNQAAAYLGISRPLLVKLLNDGTIPARTLPGSSHRRVSVADLEHTTRTRPADATDSRQPCRTSRKQTCTCPRTDRELTDPAVAALRVFADTKTHVRSHPRRLSRRGDSTQGI